MSRLSSAGRDGRLKGGCYGGEAFTAGFQRAERPECRVYDGDTWPRLECCAEVDSTCPWRAFRLVLHSRLGQVESACSPESTDRQPECTWSVCWPRGWRPQCSRRRPFRRRFATPCKRC